MLERSCTSSNYTSLQFRDLDYESLSSSVWFARRSPASWRLQFARRRAFYAHHALIRSFASDPYSYHSSLPFWTPNTRSVSYRGTRRPGCKGTCQDWLVHATGVPSPAMISSHAELSNYPYHPVKALVQDRIAPTYTYIQYPATKSLTVSFFDIPPSLSNCAFGTNGLQQCMQFIVISSI